MSARELIAGVLLLSLAILHINAGPLLNTGSTGGWASPEYESKNVPERLKPVVIPEPVSAVVRKDEALSTAYYDTMRILSSSNQCSAFFGGPAASVFVFSNLMAGVKRAYLPSGIGVKMSGDYVNVLNAATQLKYRLFEKTSINSAGPFYQSRASISVFGVGAFQPSSREARVLMLLHELGHLMKGSDGKWLLPDDGSSVTDSLSNTRKIELICGEQIRKSRKQVVDIEFTQ